MILLHPWSRYEVQICHEIIIVSIKSDSHKLRWKLHPSPLCRLNLCFWLNVAGILTEIQTTKKNLCVIPQTHTWFAWSPEEHFLFLLWSFTSMKWIKLQNSPAKYLWNSLVTGSGTPWWLDQTPFTRMINTIYVEFAWWSLWSWLRTQKAWSGWHGNNLITCNALLVTLHHLRTL